MYEPRDVVDVDLAALPDRLEDRGRPIHVVIWHEDLVLGACPVPRDQLPLSGTALRDLLVPATLPALWGHLFEPDRELMRSMDDAPPLHELLELDDPFGELHRRLDLAPDMVGDDVSILICTRDRPDDLERCLHSLRSLDPAPGEIVVVDNASVAASTREVCESVEGVVYVREDRPGLDVARNAGLAAATRSIVLFTDDDVEVHPTLVGRIAQAFEDPSVAAVNGQVLPIELESEAQVIFETLWGLGKGFVPKYFGSLYHSRFRSRGTPVWEIGAGANMAFRRSIFDEVGGFDERLGAGAAGCGDDSEMWYRILAAGRRIRYAPLAVVRHRHRREDDALASQIRAYMRGHTAALLVQHANTGDRGNLVRLAIVLPRYFADRAVMRLISGPAPDSAMLRHEVTGSMAGVVYYLRNRRRSRGAW